MADYILYKIMVIFYRRNYVIFNPNEFKVVYHQDFHQTFDGKPNDSIFVEFKSFL